MYLSMYVCMYAMHVYAACKRGTKSAHGNLGIRRAMHKKQNARHRHNTGVRLRAPIQLVSVHICIYALVHVYVNLTLSRSLFQNTAERRSDSGGREGKGRP
jgi:small-conductance mechanosensitive channel